MLETQLENREKSQSDESLRRARETMARLVKESEKHISRVDRVSTGIPGLNAMIEGGFLSGRAVLIAGGPGCGKTIACGQFLHYGIAQNERGIFVSLDENRERFYHEMSRFGWDFEQSEREGMFRFLDASPSPDLEANNHHSLSQIINSLSRLIQDLGAKRVVVDGLAALGFEFPDAVDRRRAFLRLIQTVTSSNVTSILTSEIRVSALDRPIQVEEYLADGTIVMQNLILNRTLTRTIQVEKMRGTVVDGEIRPYQITPNGVVVFNTEKVI